MKNTFSKLFGVEYVQGYTAALMDALRTIDQLQDDLKRHKRKQNYKTYRAILECILENRVVLRENPGAFIRCSDKAKNGFEVFEER